jgi:hypothetical protein
MRSTSSFFDSLDDVKNPAAVAHQLAASRASQAIAALRVSKGAVSLDGIAW